MTAGVEVVVVVEGLGEAELQFLDGGGAGAAVQVGDGFAAGDDADALMIGGEEVVVEDLGAGVGRSGGDDDEGRKVLVERAQAVADPRSDAGGREKKNDPVCIASVAW